LAVTSFAARAVAPCRATHEASTLVGEGDAQPVDLELGHVLDRGAGRACALADALVEGAELLFVVGVVETEHRLQMLDGRKPLRRAPGHPPRRRIGRDEVGILRFERFQFVEQPVEFRVGNLRIVVDVVTLFVVPDGLAQIANPRDEVLRAGHRSRERT
jgi:hypothetical protein